MGTDEDYQIKSGSKAIQDKPASSLPLISFEVKQIFNEDFDNKKVAKQRESHQTIFGLPGANPSTMASREFNRDNSAVGFGSTSNEDYGGHLATGLNGSSSKNLFADVYEKPKPFNFLIQQSETNKKVPDMKREEINIDELNELLGLNSGPSNTGGIDAIMENMKQESKTQKMQLDTINQNVGPISNNRYDESRERTKKTSNGSNSYLMTTDTRSGAMGIGSRASGTEGMSTQMNSQEYIWNTKPTNFTRRGDTLSNNEPQSSSRDKSTNREDIRRRRPGAGLFDAGLQIT